MFRGGTYIPSFSSQLLWYMSPTAPAPSYPGPRQENKCREIPLFSSRVFGGRAIQTIAISLLSKKSFPGVRRKKLSIMVFAIPRSASYGCAATPYLHANLLVQCFGSIAAQAVSPSRVPASPHQHLPYLRRRSLLQELDALNCVFIRLSISIWQAQS